MVNFATVREQHFRLAIVRERYRWVASNELEAA